MILRVLVAVSVRWCKV